MKKIIIFNASSFIYGAERGLINLIKALKGRFEITVVLPCSGPIESKIKSVSCDIDIKKFSLPVLSFSFSPFYFFKFLFLLPLNLFYFIFYIRKHNFDTVCTNSLLLFFPALIAKIIKRRHIWFVREFLLCNILNRIGGLFIERFSDKVICQSDFIKEKLRFSENSRVIYEPLDSDNYKVYEKSVVKKEFNLPQDSIVISLVSRIHPSKGQYEFIRKMKQALIKHKNLFILIAGDITPANSRNISYKRKIEKLKDKNNLKNIIFLGFRKDIDKIFSLSDVCVFPFKREEPFGISAAEALSFGKLTFFPKKGGLREVFQIYKTGYDYDTEKIIEAALNFKNMPDKNLQNIFIPDALSFPKYQNKIRLIFES